MGVWFRGGLPRESRNHQNAIIFELILHCNYFCMGVWFREVVPREPRSHQNAIIFALQSFFHGGVVSGRVGRRAKLPPTCKYFCIASIFAWGCGLGEGCHASQVTTKVQVFLHGGVVWRSCQASQVTTRVHFFCIAIIFAWECGLGRVARRAKLPQKCNYFCIAIIFAWECGLEELPGEPGYHKSAIIFALPLFLHGGVGEECQASQITTKMKLFLDFNYFCMGVWFGGVARRARLPPKCKYFCMDVWFGEGCQAHQVTTKMHFFALQFVFAWGVVWRGLPRSHVTTKMFFLHFKSFQSRHEHAFLVYPV